MNGLNFVPRSRSQGSCGNCFVNAAIAAIEGRIQVLTGGKLAPHLSVEQVTACSFQSEGCNGGFAIQVAKHGWEFGFVDHDEYEQLGVN